jgi:hypothetical protein
MHPAMLSISKEQRYLSLKDRCRGGFFFLKKRRISLDNTLLNESSIVTELRLQRISNNENFNRSHCANFPPKDIVSEAKSRSHLMLQEAHSGNMTALSLIATAAASAYPALSSSKLTGAKNTSAPRDNTQDVRKVKHSSSPQHHPFKTNKKAHKKDCTDFGDCSVTHTKPSNAGSLVKTSKSVSKKQAAHKENKLYYQQNVLRVHSDARKSFTVDEKASSAATFSHVDKPSEKPQLGANNTSSTQAHQDKRYTGTIKGEIRCLATTTRGRACAYLAVNGTKYCYLHADYDTNPPPRRGGKKEKELNPIGSSVTSSSNNSFSEGSCSLVVGNSSASASSLSGLDKLSQAQVVPNSSPPSVASDETFRLPSPLPTANTATVVNSTEKLATSSNKRSRRATSSKLAAKHADSPFPLLSMIATDQWYHKRVKVASGPLEGKVGTVEKWGNGWVSVNIPGVGFHNRRSFELFLHSEESDKEEEREQALSVGRDEKESSRSLFRCVSRDVVSPLPYSSNKSNHNSKSQDTSYLVDDATPSFHTRTPSQISNQHCPMFHRGPSSDLSPIPSKNISNVSQAPKVTPLPPKKMHPCDDVAFAVALQIPDTGANAGVTSLKRKR